MARYRFGMKHDQHEDVRKWIEPPAPGEPEEGYDEWLEASIKRGLADAKAGRVKSLIR